MATREHTAVAAQLNAAVLIGGASRRMGRVKQMLAHPAGGTLVEHVVRTVRPLVVDAALVGAGPVPDTLAGLRRIADAAVRSDVDNRSDGGADPGATSPDSAAAAARADAAYRVLPAARPAERHGPLVGLLGALRDRPDGAWLLLACDLARISAEAVRWLVGQRRAGAIAVMPRISGRLQPTFAVYEPDAREAVEVMVLRGERAPRKLADDPRVATPEVPANLASAWRGVNTPAAYARILEGG